VCETQYSKVVPLEGGEVSGQTLVIEINTELWVLRLSQSLIEDYGLPGCDTVLLRRWFLVF